MDKTTFKLATWNVNSIRIRLDLLKKLAEKIGVPYEKVPMNVVEEFGNSSGACIPVCATYNIADILKSENHRYCLSAFGSGLTWEAMVMNIGKLDFCEILVSDC